MKHILSTLAFYAKHESWQSFNRRSRATCAAVQSLARRGYLEVNEFHQARFTGKVFA
jgi:hypothetical protein